jgi:hypothetical protein
MSWKNIKDHYRIVHTVQIRNGIICIGTSFVPHLIRISFDGNVTWGSLGASKNDDLARYYAEMTADLTKLKELIDTPDTFAVNLPVYTYEGSNILEKQCEAYGYPHITHDGLLQYENTFSSDKQKVIIWAKENARLGISSLRRRLKEVADEHIKAESSLNREVTALAKLNVDYPETPA